MKSLPVLIIAVASFTLLAPSATRAANATWSGTTDNVWSTGTANWSGGSVPVSDDSLIFTSITGAGGLNLNNNLTSGSFNVAGITFNPGAAAFVIGDGTTGANVGNTFVLTGNITNNSTSLATINCPFSMTAPRTFTVSGGGLTLGGNISGTGGGITITGPGILTLSGNITYTGTTTGKGGSIVLDYSGGSNTADPIGTGGVTLDMGTLELKGKTSGATADTNSSFTMSSAVGEANTLRLTANGGSGVTPTVTTFNMASAASISQTLNLIDLSSSAANSLTLSALGTTAKVFNGILITSPDSGTSGRANLVVRNSTDYGFATLSGATSGTIGILSSGTTLTASSSSATVNYFLTAAGTLTRSADLNFSTLTIDSTLGAVTLDMGTTYKCIQNGNGRGLLVKGANDVNINGSAAGAMFPSAGSLWVHNYASGTLNLGLTMPTGGSVMFGGTGLTVWSGTAAASPGTLVIYVEGGIFRPAAATDLSGVNGLFVTSGATFEIGADLNGVAAGDMANSVGNSAGSANIRLWGNVGLSAKGADRIVAFGGVAAPTALTWGANNFLTANGGSGDGNYTLKLSSDKSDAMVTIRNAIALGSNQRTIEVANGTAATDATLGGILSSATGGGVNKTGAGTLALAGNNTYTGPTIVNTGTLNLSHQNAAQNSTLTMSGGSLVFDSSVSGHAFTLGGVAAASAGSGYDIALKDNASTPNAVALTVGGNNGDTTYAGVLGDIGSLTKAGTGKLVLSGANTYTSDTIISAGTLKLDTAGTLANTPNIIVASGAGFDVSTPTTALTLGSGQTLKASATGATTTGTIKVGSSKNLTLGGTTTGLAFTAYGGGATAPLTVDGTAGALDLNSKPVTVTTTTALAAGTYKLIAKSGAGATVTGTPGTLTVNGSSTAAGTATPTLRVTSGELYLDVPPATLTLGNDGPICAGNTLNLTANAVSGGTYAWTGPSFTSSLQNPSIANATTAASGTYHCNVTVSGLTSADATTTAVVNANPSITTVAGALSSGTYNTAGYSQTISATGATGFTATGLPGGLSLNGTSGVISGTPNVSGTFSSVVVTATNASGCSDAKTYSITINKATTTATLAVANTPQTYTGSGQSATVSITASNTPGAVANIQLGGAATQTVSGTYAVTADYVPTDTNYTTVTGIAVGNFVIDPASTFVGASSTKNPSGYKDTVAYIATLPADATGSVVFSSTNGPISTNAVSSGSATSLSITNLPRGTNLITIAYLGDGNYLGSTTNLNQIVTNHPPMLAPLNLTRTAGLGLHFPWSQLTNQWSDADDDAVNLTTFNLSTTNSVSLITNATLIGYPSTAPNVADQINYTASDSYGDTVAGVINITINAYVTGTNSIVNITTGNPTTLTAYGVIGFSYITERSTNLTDWASIATNTVSTNGLISVSDSFSDLGGTPPSSAYYRIKWQP